MSAGDFFGTRRHNLDGHPLPLRPKCRRLSSSKMKVPPGLRAWVPEDSLVRLARDRAGLATFPSTKWTNHSPGPAGREDRRAGGAGRAGSPSPGAATCLSSQAESAKGADSKPNEEPANLHRSLSRYPADQIRKLGQHSAAERACGRRGAGPGGGVDRALGGLTRARLAPIGSPGSLCGGGVVKRSASARAISPSSARERPAHMGRCQYRGDEGSLRCFPQHLDGCQFRRAEVDAETAL